MKKLMFVAAAALCGSLFADTAITSANVVGYTQSPEQITANEYTLCTTPFSSVGKSTVAVKDMIISTAKAVGYDVRESQGAAIQVWNGIGYDLYWYINDAGDNYDETGWADSTGYITESKVACGTGFWYKVPSESTDFTISGQVLDAASVTKDVPLNTYSLMGNPYPTSLKLSNVTTTIPAAPYDVRETSAAMLQVWNGVGYSLFWYINDAGDNYDETGWADSTGYVVTDPVADATKGLWIISPAAAGTVTFSM